MQTQKHIALGSPYSTQIHKYIQNPGQTINTYRILPGAEVTVTVPYNLLTPDNPMKDPNEAAETGL